MTTSTHAPKYRPHGRSIALAAVVIILVAAGITFLVHRPAQADDDNEHADLRHTVQRTIGLLHEHNQAALQGITCGRLRLLVDSNVYDPLNTGNGYRQNLWQGRVTEATDFQYPSIIEDTAVVYAYLKYEKSVAKPETWPVTRFSLQRDPATKKWRVCGAQTTL